MIPPEEGSYEQKRGASVDFKKQNGDKDKDEESGRLLAEVNPFADAASMRAVQLVCGIGMEQGEDREEEKIEEKQRDPEGAPTEPGFTI